MDDDTAAGSSPTALDVFGLGCVLHDLAHCGVPRGGEAATAEDAPAPAGPDARAARDGSSSGGLSTDSSARPPEWELAQSLYQRTSGHFRATVQPGTPAALRALIMRCMEPRPPLRPTAADALEDLRRQSAIPVAPPSPSAHALQPLTAIAALQ